ncbi:hypothetical protein WJX75_000820 [Coccomyxa subellipsoidea]|uniref:Protein kinase domain-containing protein n=1 Tax=Coccomyxa subellipsoidea TaxID=248742 RepID=A0ABR2YYX5_9CHLO
MALLPEPTAAPVLYEDHRGHVKVARLLLRLGEGAMSRPNFPLLKGRAVLNIFLAHTLICLLFPCSEGQSITNIRGYSPDQQGLLYIKRSIPNFNLYLRRSSINGWADRPGADVCSWSGVNCDSNGNVIGLDFIAESSVLTGSIGNVLYGASLLPNLVSLDVSDNAFTGTLPNGLAMPNIKSLILHDNYIQGELPAAWGMNGAFPQLQELDLGQNTEITGTLPAAWGSDNSSMTLLRRFKISTANLTGSLPAQWAQTLPAMSSLNISNNLISGTLPPEWSSMNLTYLKLDRNLIRGSIPSTWGANGSFADLAALSLYSNFLSGTLPATWAVNGTMPALQMIDVSRNNLSGVVPSGWGIPGQSLFVTSGNLFCGPTPTKYQVFICQQFRLGCTTTGAFPPLCPALPPVQVPAPQTGSANDYAVLRRLQEMTLKAMPEGRSNPLWDTGQPFCRWVGVQCTPDGQVRALNLSIPVYGPPVQLPQPGQPANVTLGVDGAIKGVTAEFLSLVSQLPALQSLDMTNQWLLGTLPANLSFPRLTELRLTYNDISGTLPTEWADNGAFPLLRLLALDKNWRLGGSLPAAWGRNASSMAKLEVMELGYANISGTLPASWADQLPLLSISYMGFNTLSGSLPVEWQSMNALTNFHVEGNILSGTLPNQWGSGGGQSWPYLQEFNLDANLLTGTLPSSWGANGSMPAVEIIIASRNQLTGSIPPSWGSSTAGIPRFANLSSLTLLPGNPGLCGPIPSGLPVFMNDSSGGHQLYSLPNSCPGAPLTVPAPAPIALSPAVVAPAPAASVAATIPHGAGVRERNGIIAGVITGGCALVAVVLLAAFLLVQRRRKNLRLRAQQQEYRVDSGKALYCDHKEMHDSDSIIPPSTGGSPASYVPYSSLIRLPKASRSGSGNSSGQWSDRSGTAPTGPPFFKELSSSGGGGNASTWGQAGSPRGGPGNAGVGMGSEGIAEKALYRVSLPHIMPLRDWELNLDALQVEVDEDNEEVELGRGAFGVVVKGTYRMAPVAIKRMKDQSPEQQEAFLKEMAILRACRGSRYIVPFVGASLLPGDTILAMDFMENGNLWEALTRLGRNGQPIFQWNNRGRRVAHDIALGLHFLHDLRVVHLDLKSCNVLIAADGTAKISDVGLAALMSHQYLSRTAPAGTWAWVAPEVLMAGRVTHKADIFSFGVVLWEIITTERPAWRGNLRDIRVPEEAPQEIADLVHRCTGDADGRPEAHECARIIGRHLQDGDASVKRRSDGSGKLRQPTGGAAQLEQPAGPPVQVEQRVGDRSQHDQKR